MLHLFLPALPVPVAVPVASTTSVVVLFLSVLAGASVASFLWIAVEVLALAFRARIRARGAAGHCESVVAFGTNEVTISFHGNGSPFDSYRQAMHQRLGDLPAGTFNEPSEGCPRHIDLFRGVPVMEPFQIPQAKGFQLIQAQSHRVGFPERDPGRFEYPRRRFSADPSAFVRSSHLISFPYIMSICS